MTAGVPSVSIRGQYRIDAKLLFAPIDLCLAAGKWTCLLGPSGVGKTTILRLLAGLPCAGQFEGDIRASDGLPISGRASFMAQTDLLLPWASVLENAVLGARLRGQTPDLQRAKTLLVEVGLGAYLSARPSALSGGMRQRVALIRTLIEDRPVAFLDEPFSALDAGTRAAMQERAFSSLKGKTVLLVTHDPSEAVRLGHQVILLTKDGTQVWPLPEVPPLRDPYDARTLAAQSGLLKVLKEMSWAA